MARSPQDVINEVRRSVWLNRYPVGGDIQDLISWLEHYMGYDLLPLFALANECGLRLEVNVPSGGRPLEAYRLDMGRWQQHPFTWGAPGGEVTAELIGQCRAQLKEINAAGGAEKWLHRDRPQEGKDGK
jgi:hypothetical protein